MIEYLSIVGGALGSILLYKISKKLGKSTFFVDSTLSPAMVYITFYGPRELAYFVDMLGICYYYSRLQHIVGSYLDKLLEKEEKKPEIERKIYTAEETENPEEKYVEKYFVTEAETV